MRHVVSRDLSRRRSGFGQEGEFQTRLSIKRIIYSAVTYRSMFARAFDSEPTFRCREGCESDSWLSRLNSCRCPPDPRADERDGEVQALLYVRLVNHSGLSHRQCSFLGGRTDDISMISLGAHAREDHGGKLRGQPKNTWAIWMQVARVLRRCGIVATQTTLKDPKVRRSTSARPELCLHHQKV